MRILDARALLWSMLPCALLLAANPARADDIPLEAAPPVADSAPATVSHWYGGRLLLADAASLAVLAGGASLRATPVALLGFAGLFVASPIVHAAHAGLGRGVTSLALRLALPTLGFLLAKSATDGCWRDPNASDTCDFGAEIGGTLLGGIAAEVIDVVWLAHDVHPVEPPPGGGGHASAQLVVVPQNGGTIMGLAGRF
jgi:hypothetical protein